MIDQYPRILVDLKNIELKQKNELELDESKNRRGETFFLKVYENRKF